MSYDQQNRHLKIQAWAEEDFRKHLPPLLKYYKAYRKETCEEQWRQNEEVMYNAALGRGSHGSVTIEDLEGSGEDENDVSVRDVAINYVFRDIKYMHALMSANPPTIKVIPNSVDAKDEDSAEAADLTSRWAREKYKLQEVHDNRNLKVLTKGTGYIRTVWDTTLGDILKFGKEDGLPDNCLVMSGEIRVYSPSTWNVWIDPDAEDLEGVKGYFELVTMPMEEAIMRWPEYEDELKSAGEGNKGHNKKGFFGSRDSGKEHRGRNTVDIYIYTEKGMAINGKKGRYAAMLEHDDGCILEFGANDNPNAGLGLDILTDIDVEDQVYGKSIIEYLDRVQMVIQSLDANSLANIAAHNTIRMYVSNDSDINDEALSNSELDVIRGEPGHAPQFLPPPSLMPDAWRFRDQLHQGSREMSGINESMLGEASRETSSYTTQTHINQGNMARRRLFNKAAASTKNIYMMILSLIVENWTEKRQVKVLGDERAYQIKHLSGNDIDGGWDIIAEYGQNFSLDPNTARDQIMQLFPMFEKIPGFDYASLADAVRLNVMDNYVDQFRLAKRKQRRIFKEMIRAFKQLGTEAYIEPQKMENHEQMLAYCRIFVMTEEYDNLDEMLQGLIDKHIEAREKIIADLTVAAQQAQMPPAAPGAPPGPPAAPAAPAPQGLAAVQ